MSCPAVAPAQRRVSPHHVPSGMPAHVGGDSRQRTSRFPYAQQQTTSPEQQGREGGAKSLCEIYFCEQADVLAGHTVLSVNGCRLLPAARTGRSRRCLLLSQVVISDLGSLQLRPGRVCKQQLDLGCTQGISTPPLVPRPLVQAPLIPPVTLDPSTSNGPCPGTRRPMQ